jgi:hypothetical protein
MGLMRPPELICFLKLILPGSRRRSTDGQAAGAPAGPPGTPAGLTLRLRVRSSLGVTTTESESLPLSAAPSLSRRKTRKSPARRHRDPDSPAVPPPAESGNGDSRRIGTRNRGFPVSRFSAKSGIGGTGIGDLGLWPTELVTR